MELEFLSKIADTYERKARLYPALLAIVPVLAVSIFLYGIELKIESATLGLLSTFGFFYLFATIARELGKRKEEALYKEWNGKPTTQLLRHNNDRLNPNSKNLYHIFLGKHLGIEFPTKLQEEADPIKADQVYDSGAKWLLSKTRDTNTFSLLFKENISYGFRRNCLGIKPFSILISLISILWVLIEFNIVSSNGIQIREVKSLTSGAKISLMISAVMCLIWVFFFTRKTVKTSAFDYAEKLLMACDVLPKKR